MSNFSKAADDIKNVASKLRGMLEVADALEQIGNIEQASRNAEIAKDKAYKDAAEAKAQAIVAAAQLDGVLEDIKIAKAQAAEILASAKDQAQKSMDAMNVKVVEVQASFEKKIQLSKQNILEAGKELVAIQEQIISEKNVLADIKLQVTGIKNKLQAVVGA